MSIDSLLDYSTHKLLYYMHTTAGFANHFFLFRKKLNPDLLTVLWIIIYPDNMSSASYHNNLYKSDDFAIKYFKEEFIKPLFEECKDDIEHYDEQNLSNMSDNEITDWFLSKNELFTVEFKIDKVGDKK